MARRLASVAAVAALARLVRAPAALTVPGDALAGAAAAGRGLRGRRLALPAASVCLYWAGMALNDFADRAVDAAERPERPIPSGRVSPAQALAAAVALTAAGVALAGIGAGRAALRVAVPLGAAVWAYDVRLKNGPLGPVAMAACRGLDVLLGAVGPGAAAGPARRDGPSGVLAALPAALAVAGHTAGVTALARGEVHGSSPATALAAAAGTVLVGLSVVAGPAASRRHRLLAGVGAAGYGLLVGRAQLAAGRDPGAGAVRRATVAGITGLVPLQAALAARAGAPVAAAALLTALPVARALADRVSPT